MCENFMLRVYPTPRGSPFEAILERGITYDYRLSVGDIVVVADERGTLLMDENAKPLRANGQFVKFSLTQSCKSSKLHKTM